MKKLQTTKHNETKVSKTSSFFQGSIAALVGKTCTAPLDRLKILIQTQQPDFKEVGAFKNNKNGIISAINRIISREGFFALYRGNHIAQIRHGLHGGIDFMLHDTLQHHFNNEKHTVSKNLIIGSCCGVGATLVTFPFETMRVMIATNQGNLRQLAKSHGGSLKLVKRGYSGLSAGLIGVIPYAGLNFGLRDIFKDLLHQNKIIFLGDTKTNCFDQRGIPGFKTSFVLGVYSGLLTQAIVYPVEVVKRRRQNIIGKSYPCIIKELYASGLRSTYAGFSLNIIRHPICNGIVWGVRDFLKRNQYI